MKIISYLAFALVFLALCAPDAQARERQKPQKQADRPYGNSLDNDFQTEYYSKRRGEAGESLFSQDLHGEAPIGYKPEPRSFTENQSYLNPPRRKTNPSWGDRNR
jgi:hypothetical protein